MNTLRRRGSQPVPHHCDEITETINYTEGRIIWLMVSAGFSPWSVGSIALRLVAKQHIITGGVGWGGGRETC